MTRNYSSQSGVALLMSLGILAILSILGVAFSTNMRLMERTTRDFVHEIQARYLAEGGIEYAIAQLKEDARNRFVFDVIGENGELNISGIELPQNMTGSIKITITDTASQININNASIDLLRGFYNVGPIRAQNIINYRSQHPFFTKKELKLAGFNDLYNQMKESFTVWGYSDENSDGRSAININTASLNISGNNPPVVVALDELLGNRSTARNVATQFNNYVGSSGPFRSWREFDEFVDNNLTGITPSGKNLIKNNANPNRVKPSVNTTEFCFHSGGTYEITVTGTVTKDDQTLAKKTVTSTVKIFDLLNHTTTAQFGAGDVNNSGLLSSGGSINKVTGLDNCPVRSDQDWNGTTYDTIPGSLKIGYWDDFTTRSNIEPWVDQKSLPGELTSFNGVADMPQWGAIILSGLPNLEWSNCSATIQVSERTRPPNAGEISDEGGPNNAYETGWFIFRYKAEYNEDSCSQIYYDRLVDRNGDLKRNVPDGYPFVYTIMPSQNNWIPRYPSLGWRNARTFYIPKTYRVIQNRLSGSSNVDYVELYMLTGSNTTRFSRLNLKVNANFTRTNTEGFIKLSTGTKKPGNLPQDVDPEGGTHWDNLRIIPDRGEYTSAQLNLTQPVDWGMVWGTVTRPDSVQNPLDIDVEIEIPLGSTEMNFTAGAPIGIANSASIQYKLNFYSTYSDTNKYLETPVLEDVWITYLPKTKILYWKEGE